MGLEGSPRCSFPMHVAYRYMVEVASGSCPGSESASTAILQELEKTGAFLADPNHYQSAENHGTNEAAALYNLAVAFPSLPNAQQWKQLAADRFEWQLMGIIDADGQLVENSPYYDFYTLEKYWGVYSYMLAQRQTPPAGMWSKLASMINFASYILQPNSQVPLLADRLRRPLTITCLHQSPIDPQFLYVLTHGAKGSAPPVDSEFFPASSLTVMRSGWPSGTAYADSTYLTFNLGRYRTAHSDLDAMGITLYGDGGDLLPDPGLYTYRKARIVTTSMAQSRTIRLPSMESRNARRRRSRAAGY